MNEPVAYRHWMIDEEFPEDSCWEYFDAPTGKDCKECIPLYTHPVSPKYDPETGEPLIDGYPLFSGLPHPVKELTDEELSKVYEELYINYAGKDFPVDLGRAILRKAQEK